VRTHGPVCPSARETTQPAGVMTLTINARPAFNNVYVLEPNVSYDDWNWTVRPGIKVFNAVKVSFGSKAKEAIDKALGKARDEINRDLTAKLDFQNKVREAWASLHEPHALGSDGTLWLSVKPLSLHATPVVSDSAWASIYAGLKSKNEAVLGARPNPHDLVALPILLPGVPDTGFQLTAVARFEYAAVVQRAKQELVGKTLQMKWGRLTIEDIAAYQTGDRLALGVKALIRPKKMLYVRGWLHLLGRPEIEAGRLRLRNLDYRANTNNPLIQAFAFLFREPAKRELERKLTFDLQPSLQNIVDRLNSIPPKPIGSFGELRTRMDSIVIETPVADAKAMLVPVTGKGKAEAVFLPYAGSSLLTRR
jgi:hypothetical protein